MESWLPRLVIGLMGVVFGSLDPLWLAIPCTLFFVFTCPPEDSWRRLFDFIRNGGRPDAR